MKNGETKRIIIDTADNAYFIEANGYMSGEIKLVVPIDENIEWLEKHRRSFIDGSYEPREEDIIFIKKHWD
ncbi:MAG: hypothetical protein IJN12_01240 [Clostridia bacterium]|nr:hypothetical protein [Clostridia bacterium]